MTAASFDDQYEQELRQNYGGKEGSRSAKAVHAFYAQDDDEVDHSTWPLEAVLHFFFLPTIILNSYAANFS